MTARLDGPTPEIANHLVDDAIAVEAVGLKGKAVVDARRIRFDPRGGDDPRPGQHGVVPEPADAARLANQTGEPSGVSRRAR
ncbi:MAG: hypothetical protein K2P78_11515 [Gemmataceae bacterium]|nr:hypothetical protein [Gemmataceae bacterium]